MWTWWERGSGRWYGELDWNLMPSWEALELEVIHCEGRTWACWVLSQTGQVLAVMRGAQA